MLGALGALALLALLAARGPAAARLLKAQGEAGDAPRGPAVPRGAVVVAGTAGEERRFLAQWDLSDAQTNGYGYGYGYAYEPDWYAYGYGYGYGTPTAAGASRPPRKASGWIASAGERRQHPDRRAYSLPPFHSAATMAIPGTRDATTSARRSCSNANVERKC